MITPAIVRFLSKVSIVDSGCWLWIGCLQSSGYGLFWNGKKNQTAHRFIYEYYYRKITSQLTIDHVCKIPICVNPLHLEQVPFRVNFLRGNAPAAINARKTHCKRGHEFTPENTYNIPKGGRMCKICHMGDVKRFLAKKHC